MALYLPTSLNFPIFTLRLSSSTSSYRSPILSLSSLVSVVSYSTNCCNSAILSSFSFIAESFFFMTYYISYRLSTYAANLTSEAWACYYRVFFFCKSPFTRLISIFCQFLSALRLPLTSSEGCSSSSPLLGEKSDLAATKSALALLSCNCEVENCLWFSSKLFCSVWRSLFSESFSILITCNWAFNRV